MKERPAPQILWSWRLAATAVALPLTGALCWLLQLFWPAYLPAALWIWGGFLAGLLGIYMPLRRRSISFSLEAEQVTVTGGVWFSTTRCMRADAVRQVTLWQGPLERRLGIAYLLISATGGSLLIEGIPRPRAEEWCQRLSPV